MKKSENRVHYMLRSVGTWHSTRFKTPCSQPLQPLQMSALLQKTMVLKTKVSPLCGAWTADRAEKDGEAGALPTRGFGGASEEPKVPHYKGGGSLPYSCPSDSTVSSKCAAVLAAKCTPVCAAFTCFLAKKNTKKRKS